MEKLLEVDRLTKIFFQGSLLSRTKITAVDAVSFHIEPGEIFALAGESGCGKTTIAKIILDFEEKTSGSILYKGQERTSVKGNGTWSREAVQAVFQDPFETFNPLRRVDRYFFEAAKNFKLAENREETIDLIAENLSAVGLSYDEFYGKYPSEFSGGQLQRVSIARSLLTDPRLLIADEPVSMVDASLRMSIVNLFRELRDEFNMSVLYITHDLATAYYMSDRIAIMFRGHLVEMGPVEQVLMEPKHPYTQLLEESIPKADPQERWEEDIDLLETEEEEYLKQGCRFAGRCPFVMKVCRERVPPDVQVDDVLVKCFRYAEFHNKPI